MPPEEKSQGQSYRGVSPAGYNTNWPGKICPLGQQWHKYGIHFVTGFKPWSMRWNSYLILLTGTKGLWLGHGSQGKTR